MVFSDELIKIKKPIFVVRFNNSDGLSPYEYQPWYYMAKSVEDENGIYSVLLDDLLTNDFGFYEKEFQNPENDILLMETAAEFLISSKKTIFNIEDVHEKLNITEEEKPKWGYLELKIELFGGVMQETVFTKANILYVTKGDDIEQLKKIFTNFINTGIKNPKDDLLTKLPFHYSSKEIASEIDFELIKQFAIKGAWIESDLHGPGHWQNVERNGLILAQSTGANVRVIRLFAYFHDMCRLSDGYDSNHGQRVTKILGHARNTLLSGLTDMEFKQLCLACSRHTSGSTTKDVTINTCFDADRLDLTRLGIKPDPKRMATEIGAFYANNPDEFKNQIELWNKK